MEFNPPQDYNWSTEYYHSDNSFTMNDFLENHLPANFLVIHADESYAEIKDMFENVIYAINAKGNGDSFNHVITSGAITQATS